ncbi:MAG TPA: shikimate dehydrogenase [Phenylobacterium sp.]|jgi:shikimate dehydrogenase|uniref:shikimate dehydrogenase n=1 Tax=Phenylobacterium sp. TaxID=1871053 RepID=UPI002D368C11|nr:shikimate dehydrogenase [Phenylobacterium sp.]HZZ69865.1 shikimate dehydrogenase [Phenylobacterium sp.]
MTRSITGATAVAGVAGSPIAHSLSPLIQNAWIKAAGLDAVYVPFSPPPDRFSHFAEGLRGGAVRGLNVTLPFKEAALSVAHEVGERAERAGAANLLIFNEDGSIVADNVDGLGLLGALASQAPGFDPKAGPAVVMGAGGAARGAASALVMAGAPEVRLVNRTLARAEVVAGAVGGATRAFSLDEAVRAFDGANVVVNATSAGVASDDALNLPLEGIPATAVAMDMTYSPLITPFLSRARLLGHPIVDGLEMLVRQAGPSFEAFFGRVPPADVDVRALCIAALDAKAGVKA